MDFAPLISLALAVVACPVEETYNDFMSAVAELPDPPTELEDDLLMELIDLTTIQYLGTCTCNHKEEHA